MSKLNDSEREIVNTLIETNSVNFEAVGATLAKFGPSAVLNLDYEDVFCGTMRTYVHVYRLPGVQGPGVLDSLAALRTEVAKELRS